MENTPYSEEITALGVFYQEVKESELSKKGIRDYTSGVVKSSVLPRHIQEISHINQEQHQREKQISSNIELVNARAQDLEMSSNQFIDGEEAYQRLLQAKNMD